MRAARVLWVWVPASMAMSMATLLSPAIAAAQQPPRAPAAAPPAPPRPAANATPAPPDLPPPPPPPWTGNPGATMPPDAPIAPPPATDTAPPNGTSPSPPPTVAASTDVAALERRLANVEHRLAEARHELHEQERTRLHQEDVEKIHWLRHFKASGFLQPQLVWQWFNAAASPNADANGALPAGISPNSAVARADGTTTNPDFFRLRRARLKIEFSPSESARFVFEIDPTSIGGPSGGVGTIARNVEVVGTVHWPGGFEATTEFGMGIFKIPFGYEVLQSDADRPFIERSWAEQNLFPGEYDTGARAYSSLFDRHLHAQVAVVNGNIQGEKTFAVLPDLDKGKDLVGRLSYDLGIATIGASGYYGQGHILDTTLLRFKQFPRWAYGFELGIKHRFLPSIGETRLFAEIVRAQNLDRGTRYGQFAVPTLPSFPADVPNGTVNDHDELGGFVRVEQDLGRHFTLAARYDYYTPDSAQGSNGRDTFGVVGVVHFTRALQWMLEYDHAVDNVHRPGGPLPSRQIDTLSNVLQARF